jgi:hypothetical protein
MDTGFFLTRTEYLDSHFCPKSLRGNNVIRPEFSPNGPWAIVSGICTFPIEVSRTIHGEQAELGTASNSKPTSKSVPGVIGEYETEGIKWNTSTRQVRPLNRPEVVEMFKNVPLDLNFQWAVDGFIAQITGPPTVVPPCTDIIMKFTPSVRVVSLVPVFHVGLYKMDLSGRMNKWVYETLVLAYDSWRDWGEEWMDIFCGDYLITSMANVLTDGPDGLEPTVAGVVDYDFERRPQCP